MKPEYELNDTRTHIICTAVFNFYNDALANSGYVPSTAGVAISCRYNSLYQAEHMDSARYHHETEPGFVYKIQAPTIASKVLYKLREADLVPQLLEIRCLRWLSYGTTR